MPAVEHNISLNEQCVAGGLHEFSFLLFFFLLLYSKNPTLFMRKLHTLYEFFRVLVNLEISDLHDLDTVLCCVIMPKVSFSLLEDYEFLST